MLIRCQRTPLQWWERWWITIRPWLTGIGASHRIHRIIIGHRPVFGDSTIIINYVDKKSHQSQSMRRIKEDHKKKKIKITMMCFTLYILWNVWNDMLNQSKQQAKLLDPLPWSVLFSRTPRSPFFFFSSLAGTQLTNADFSIPTPTDSFFSAHLGYLVYHRDR